MLAFISIFAIWANRQAFNTDNWTETSSKLLEDDEIRAQLSTYLVDQLYANYNVTEEVAGSAPTARRRPRRSHRGRLCGSSPSAS